MLRCSQAECSALPFQGPKPYKARCGHICLSLIRLGVVVFAQLLSPLEKNEHALGLVARLIQWHSGSTQLSSDHSQNYSHSVSSVSYAQQRLALSLSEGLKKAHNECKAKVECNAAQCRVVNIGISILSFCFLCPYSIPILLAPNLLKHLEMSNSTWKTNLFITSDVRRVADI